MVCIDPVPIFASDTYYMNKLFFLLIIIAGMSCNAPEPTVKDDKVNLVTLDPGHFHAALVQKSMYDEVSPHVHVYAPAGPDVQLHLDRINAYNNRAENPTKWDEELYTGDDYFEKMLTGNSGKVVVMLAGNNRKKTEYILKSLQAGFNVLADKPMVIDSANFELLKQAFDTAAGKKLLLYDIMTERYEMPTILQREFSMMPEVFGTLEKGTPENPAVVKESVHYFYKFISGKVNVRPGWFMDVTQQGEGIVDVMTHVVDLVQWECFPEQAINYTSDIQVNTAKRWPTDMSLSEFSAITKLDSFPAYLQSSVVKDSVLPVYSNGEINYSIRGSHVKTSVIWKYKAPEGQGDSYYGLTRGTKANLVVRQGADENFKPTLYIEPVKDDTAYASVLTDKLKSIQQKYPGIELKRMKKGWQVVIPEKYIEGHEAHFARVTQKYLEYLKNGNMPSWEVPNMIAKYYTTIKALELARKQ
jgi:predicted dehydrogenase